MTFEVLTIVFTFLLSNSIHSTSNFNCWKNFEDVRCTMGSVMPYRFIANYDDAEIKFPDCTAEKIWLIIRHGTRSASENILELFDNLSDLQNNILNHCKKEKCFLSDKQLANFGEWKAYNSSEEELMVLTKEGQEELIGLAKRYRSRFPKLMPEKYENTTYRFQSTTDQRTLESAKYFITELFGKQQSEQIQYPGAEHEDRVLLLFYKVCEKWKKEVDDNPDFSKEAQEFKQGPLVNEMLRNISQRLGINANYDTVKTIQSTCAFETAWNKKSESPWCPLLTLEEYKIAEFLEDLRYYWIDGYGHSMTTKIACPVLTDMFDFIKSKNEFKTSAYFTHSRTLLMLLASLGIAKDNEPLRHNSYNLSENRLWRMSALSTFATNIAFILYNCKSGPSVLIMHQERIINLPGCPKDVPCPLKIMEDNYPDRKEECNFDKMCSISDSP